MDSGQENPAKWESGLTSMIEVAASELRRLGRPEPAAAHEAEHVVCAIAAYYGGRQFYLPRGDSLKRARRDQDIAKRLGRESAEDLAVEYGLSVSRVYKIAKHQHKTARLARNRGNAP